MFFTASLQSLDEIWAALLDTHSGGGNNDSCRDVGMHVENKLGKVKIN